jgi:PadR family transcriptional regulator PadR
MDAQLKKGLLEVCVLAAIREEETYGYKIVSEIAPYVEISESTLYPVLRRMQKEGQLETYDRPYQGRNRRYYRITPAGAAALEVYRNAWRDYRAGIDELIGGEDA